MRDLVVRFNRNMFDLLMQTACACMEKALVPGAQTTDAQAQ
jgi:hypothetical protein